MHRIHDDNWRKQFYKTSPNFLLEYDKNKNPGILSPKNSLLNPQIKNKDGKTEAVELEIIETLNDFLTIKDVEILNENIKILMFISLDERGKLEIINFEKETIVRRVVSIIFHSQNATLKNNCILLLMNISEKLEGFKSIIKHLMIDRVAMNQIFGVRSLYPLYL